MSANIVVTLHGIQTFGKWQDRLEKLVVRENANVSFEHYRYGFFSLVAFIFPPLRWLATRRFREALCKVIARNPTATFSIVAHSFGTHLAAHALRSLPKQLSPVFTHVILCGSVLKSEFDWSPIVDRGLVRSVVNECGTRDFVLLLSQFFVFFTGWAGWDGFSGMTNERFMNRFFRGGHSLYFVDQKGPSDDFMERYWVPILAHNKAAIFTDERGKLNAHRLILRTFVPFAEPTKAIIFLLIVLSSYRYFVELPAQRLEIEAAGKLAAMQATRDAATKEIAARLLREQIDNLNADRSVPNVVAFLAHLFARQETGSTEEIELPLRYWIGRIASLEDYPSNRYFSFLGKTYFRYNRTLLPIGAVRPIWRAVSHDKKRMFIMGADQTLRVFDLTSSAKISEFDFNKSARMPQSSTSNPSNAFELQPIFSDDTSLLFDQARQLAILTGTHDDIVVVGNKAPRLVEILNLKTGSALSIGVPRSDDWGDNCSSVKARGVSEKDQKLVFDEPPSVGTTRLSTQSPGPLFSYDWDGKLTPRLPHSCSGFQTLALEHEASTNLLRAPVKSRFPSIVEEASLWTRIEAATTPQLDSRSLLSARGTSVVRIPDNMILRRDNTPYPYNLTERFVITNATVPPQKALIDRRTEPQGTAYYVCRFAKFEPPNDTCLRFAYWFGDSTGLESERIRLSSDMRFAVSFGDSASSPLGWASLFADPVPAIVFPGTVIDATFDHPATKIAILTDHSWSLYDLRSSRLIREIAWSESAVCVGLWGSFLIASDDRRGILAIDFDRQAIVWRHQALGFKSAETVRGSLSEDRKVLALYSSSEIRLVELKTGTVLSHLHTFRRAGTAKIDAVSIGSDGAVTVNFGQMTFRRNPPLPKESLQSYVAKSERRTGIDSRDGFTPLESLPASLD